MKDMQGVLLMGDDKKKTYKKGTMKSKGAYIKYRNQAISNGEIPMGYNDWIQKQAAK